MPEARVARLVAWGRVVIGISFLVAPRRAVRAWTGHDAGAAARLAARGLGGRDLAIGAGTIAALGRGRHPGGWVGAGAVADASDAVAIMASFGDLPRARRLLFLATTSVAALIGARGARSL